MAQDWHEDQQQPSYTGVLVFFAVAGAVVGIFAPVIGLNSGGGFDAWAGAVAAGLVVGLVAVLISAISAVAALVLAGRRGERLGLPSILGLMLSFAIFAIYLFGILAVLGS
jgi:hypothetical protein